MKRTDFLNRLDLIPASTQEIWEMRLSNDGKSLLIGSIHWFDLPIRSIRGIDMRAHTIDFVVTGSVLCIWRNVETSMAYLRL